MDINLIKLAITRSEFSDLYLLDLANAFSDNLSNTEKLKLVANRNKLILKISQYYIENIKQAILDEITTYGINEENVRWPINHQNQQKLLSVGIKQSEPYKININDLDQTEYFFLYMDWEPSYGGKPWADITRAYHNLCKLYNSVKNPNDVSNISKIMSALDKIHQLEHNSGSIFSKFIEGEQKWMHDALTDKAIENSTDVLKQYSSDDVKNITNKLFPDSGLPQNEIDLQRGRVFVERYKGDLTTSLDNLDDFISKHIENPNIINPTIKYLISIGKSNIIKKLFKDPNFSLGLKITSFSTEILNFVINQLGMGQEILDAYIDNIENWRNSPQHMETNQLKIFNDLVESGFSPKYMDDYKIMHQIIEEYKTRNKSAFMKTFKKIAISRQEFYTMYSLDAIYPWITGQVPSNLTSEKKNMLTKARNKLLYTVATYYLTHLKPAIIKEVREGGANYDIGKNKELQKYNLPKNPGEITDLTPEQISDVFDIYFFTTMYGGPGWKKIAKLYSELSFAMKSKKPTSDMSDIMPLIDKIHQVEHNTGSIMTKLPDDEYLWIHEALTDKSIAASIQILKKYVEPDVKDTMNDVLPLDESSTDEIDNQKFEIFMNRLRSNPDMTSGPAVLHNPRFLCSLLRGAIGKEDFDSFRSLGQRFFDNIRIIDDSIDQDTWSKILSSKQASKIVSDTISRMNKNILMFQISQNINTYTLQNLLIVMNMFPVMKNNEIEKIINNALQRKIR